MCVCSHVLCCLWACVVGVNGYVCLGCVRLSDLYFYPFVFVAVCVSVSMFF